MARITYTYTDLYYGEYVIATFCGRLFDDSPFVRAYVADYERKHPRAVARCPEGYACQTWTTYNPNVSCLDPDDFNFEEVNYVG